MKKQKRHYPSDFKQQAIELLKTSGKSAAEIERELGITPGLLSRWKRKQDRHGIDAFPGPGHQIPTEVRVRQLEQELAIVQQERDILKKVVAIFSQPSK